MGWADLGQKNFEVSNGVCITARNPVLLPTGSTMFLSDLYIHAASSGDELS